MMLQSSSDLQKLKEIDQVLRNKKPPSSPSSSDTTFRTSSTGSHRTHTIKLEEIWLYILQCSAAIDLITFVYMKRVETVRFEQIKRYSQSKKVRKVINFIFKCMPFLKKQKNEFDNHNYIHDTNRYPMNWIEKYQYIFDILFCVSWVIEGFRVALKRAQDKQVPTQARTIFISFLSMYMILLPFHLLQKIYESESEAGHSFTSIYNISNTTIANASIPKTFHYIHHNDIALKHTNNNHEFFSLPYIIILQLYKLFMSFIISQFYILRKQVAQFIIWNPLKTKRIIYQFLPIFKTMKQIVPMFNAFNVLTKRMKKIIILRKQRLDLLLKRKYIKLLWKKMSPEERRLKACIRIQARFRGRQEKKRMQAKILEYREKERFKRAKLKQESLRSSRVLSNRIESQKRLILHLKESLNNEPIEKCDNNSIANTNNNENDKNVWMKEKMLHDKLESELRVSIIEMKNIMAIIRPNSKFCVMWNVIVFSLIVIQNIPKFIPCLPIQQQIQYQVVLSLIPPPIKIYYSIHGTAVLNVVYLMDAFVDFFTGRFDENGYLVPDSVAARWVPFILITIGNPITSATVKAIIKLCFVHSGPDRMCRWLIAFLIPFGNMVLSCLIWFWLEFVQWCNISMVTNNC